MSSALIRQALEFVDPEENSGRRNKRRSGRRRTPGQDSNPYKRNKKPVHVATGSDATEENIKKLLALSTTTVGGEIVEKIIERAIKGRPLAEKPEVKKDNGQSILFPGESFKDFENELFCS